MQADAAEVETRVLGTNVSDIAEAGAIIRAGGLVAFPTETVYGLGANALDAAAVRGIFQAKGRPADDPLIVHVGALAEVERVAYLEPRAVELGTRFWPGPLTLVLRKRADVPPEVTAGLPTVGVRVPAHTVAQALIAAAQRPVAAPSANRFSRPSPTRAEHVLEDLRGRIHAVLDGGPTTVGVESTIVDLSEVRPRLLRPGGLAVEQIERVLGVALLPAPRPGEVVAGPQVAPGLLEVHYAPRTPLILVVGSPGRARARLLSEAAGALARGQRVGVVALDDDAADLPSDTVMFSVGRWAEPAVSSARLFDALRTLDRAGLDVLLARDLANTGHGLGRALADRLRRAARDVIEA